MPAEASYPTIKVVSLAPSAASCAAKAFGSGRGCRPLAPVLSPASSVSTLMKAAPGR